MIIINYITGLHYNSKTDSAHTKPFYVVHSLVPKATWDPKVVGSNPSRPLSSATLG